MTESQPARTDGHSEPCPPWCRIDHAGHPGPCVGSGGSIDHIWTRAIRTLKGDRVTLSASLPDPDDHWPSLVLDLREAEDLAVIVEMIADATPDQHRGLAAAIRKASADIAAAGGAR